MIPTLIILLLKKYKACGSWRLVAIELQTAVLPAVTKFFGLLVLGLLLAFTLCGQKTMLQYAIFHDGEKVGHLNINSSCTSDRIQLKMESEVKTRIIFRINVFSREETIISDGKIIYSSIFRRINGDEKANQQLKSIHNGYQVIRPGQTKILDHEAFEYNMLLFYTKEPVDIHQAYSDNYQKYINIKKVDSNRYMVSLPNGSKNVYTYNAGICTMVEVNHSLYNLKFILQR